MKKLLLALIIIFTPFAHATDWQGVVQNMTELERLPRYCWGAQQINKISRDPKPIQEYLAIYGSGYYHIHHYCWAINLENSVFLMQDKLLRESKLRVALGGVQYSLDRSQPGFVFLPDMYAFKAKILFTLHRDGEAVVALRQAIEAKPDYVPAIARLSDYYVDNDDKAQAIKILEEGIGNTEKAKHLLRKLEKLGKTYQGTPGSARKKEDQDTPLETEVNQDQEKRSTATSNADLPTTPDETTKKASPITTESRPADNPYCRFCP